MNVECGAGPGLAFDHETRHSDSTATNFSEKGAMSSPILKIFAIGFLMLAVASCRAATVHNVDNMSLNAPKTATVAKVESAIKRAGASLGWHMKVVAPGHIEARLPVRRHVAVADIFYNAKDFSIKYKDSTNLNYDKADNTIHSNYNGWIQNLQNAIITQTSTL
jgi:hypothetical protein